MVTEDNFPYPTSHKRYLKIVGKKYFNALWVWIKSTRQRNLN